MGHEVGYCGGRRTCFKHVLAKAVELQIVVFLTSTLKGSQNSIRFPATLYGQGLRVTPDSINRFRRLSLRRDLLRFTGPVGISPSLNFNAYTVFHTTLRLVNEFSNTEGFLPKSDSLMQLWPNTKQYRHESNHRIFEILKTWKVSKSEEFESSSGEELKQKVWRNTSELNCMIWIQYI